MERHGLKCQIGGLDRRKAVAMHRLRRLEKEKSGEEEIRWRKKRPAPIPPKTATSQKTSKPQTHAPNMMTSVMPQIHSTCGMGTFSQKKVDEEFLKYLNG